MEVPTETVDGMSVIERERGRVGRPSITREPAAGPYFVEAITYRYVGHSRSDPGAYRPPGELDRMERSGTRSAASAASSSRRLARGPAPSTWSTPEMEAAARRAGAEGPRRAVPVAPRPVAEFSTKFEPRSVLPDAATVGLDETEATVVTWLKPAGQLFSGGEPLVEVETDKATVVYEAETDGVLEEILVAGGRHRGSSGIPLPVSPTTLVDLERSRVRSLVTRVEHPVTASGGARL